MVRVLEGMMPKLDRIPFWDDRNEEYMAPRLLELPPEPRSYTWKHLTTDQGQEGECVAFGCTQEAIARPAMVFGNLFKETLDVASLNQVSRRFFQTVREIDRAEGRHYAEGATSLAGAKAGVQWGWWKGYTWFTNVEDIARYIGTKGPVLVGTNVYTSMFTGGRGERRVYRIEPWAQVRGGHLYALMAYDAKRGLFYTPNSWGGYGQGYLEGETLQRLLNERGEAFAVTQRSLKGRKS